MIDNILITKRSFIKHFFKGLFGLFVFSKIGLFFKSANAASSVPEIILANRKKITPEIVTKGHPDFFPSTNNLRRKAGSPFLAKGYFLSIEGYITDLVDVPVENVRIKMWQANHFGYYQHLVDPEDIDKFDQDFLGCGKTITDNLGYYSFITIDPGYYDNRAPHLHFSLQYDNYNDGKPFETTMFFPDHPFNVHDKDYMNLAANKKSLVTCNLEPIRLESPSSAKRALFNFKLDMMHPVKRY
jgi:protocatechuate 3,4-dioxygenase beta subunit